MPRPKTKPEPSAVERMKLAQLCDEAIERLLASTHRKKVGIRPNQVADEVERLHPHLLSEFGRRMARAHLVRIASDRLRNGEATLRAARTSTLVLPGIDESILANLPPLITIGKGKEKRHKPITHATVGETRQYKELLESQLAADKLRYEAVAFICRLIEDQPDKMLLTTACKVVMAEAAE